MLYFLSTLAPPTTTYPFAVLEGSGEAHGLDELGKGSDLFLHVLGRLLHAVELLDRKWEGGDRKWGGEGE